MASHEGKIFRCVQWERVFFFFFHFGTTEKYKYSCHPIRDAIFLINMKPKYNFKNIYDRLTFPHQIHKNFLYS